METPATATLPSRYGTFRVMVWPASKGQEPVAITTPNLDANKEVLVRVHSECLTGDAFGSLRCDCCTQKEEALKRIAMSGNGVFVYLRQEGRGIGLFDKIRSYKLQEEGVDTHQASILLGHEPDSREYSWAKKILSELGIKKIKLLTNNPSKVSEIFDAGFDVEKAPLIIEPTEYNKEYHDIKRKKFKHTFGEKESYHYYGITYTDHSPSLDEIFTFLRSKRKHPLLKVHIGIYVDHDLLQRPEAVSSLQLVFKKISEEPEILPVAHYRVKETNDPTDDFNKIKQVFPEVGVIQLNDVPVHNLEIFSRAAELFVLIASLSDETFYLIDNAAFRDLILNKPSFVLLDNSKGRGKQESLETYQEKIGRCLNYGINNIALAGGFGPGVLETYFELKRYYKINFSIDAESKLHTNKKLDTQKVEEYFTELFHG